ncbi:NAD(P)/FAD-dependent oxidoreductase [Aspergillus mulundensis]|uniref:FAD-binding domain-containing protein n=1 Tax=Aspergillus mulundensis TaxID=1810919 RepID=A0A3D8S5H3_9EURO|nr:hypothetical protein DSM5745_05099 [Aspergillus mulundensis]RDW81542.1 hypothetical protein DSM5745_05099 [Aspergillus mulundensis]
MDIPAECTVLIVGGGPGGSYAASVLAREGIETVLLEANSFPRYHIGESLLASTRGFLSFIDALDKFESHGFRHKTPWLLPRTELRSPSTASPQRCPQNTVLTQFQTPTSFPTADTPGTRFAPKQTSFSSSTPKHAARVFDETKVTDIKFVHSASRNGDVPATMSNGPSAALSGSIETALGRPVSASWTRKDKTTGTIKFKYLIDASGRAGLVSTKYMKNRRFNAGLKNVAMWGYFENATDYGVGTPGYKGPFFHSLKDGSGWVWFIPLHNGTTSVGVVMSQCSLAARKKAMATPSTREFLIESLQHAPELFALLEYATLVSEVRSATDWSYTASSYASPYIRIVGDAGCFIDPLFSSGVHLALTGALSAAASICAVLRGDCAEESSGSWYTAKIREAYTRFLLVVTGAYAQIQRGDQDVLSEEHEKDFGRAFGFFRPIIQGAVEVTSGAELTSSEVSQSMDFCIKVIRKAQTTAGFLAGPLPGLDTKDELEEQTCAALVNVEIRGGLEHFHVDVVEGMAVHLNIIAVSNAFVDNAAQFNKDQRNSLQDAFTKVNDETGRFVINVASKALVAAVYALDPSEASA